MVGPALIYLAINMGSVFGLEGGAPRGWPVPVATDIAFAIAALAVAGPKLPPNLRVFLLTLAIVDDLGAVGLIGLLFTDHFRIMELLGALLALTGMGLLGRWRKAPYLFYLVGFVIVWGFTLKSGISTSLAGVAAAATIPLNPRKPGRPGVLEDFMEGLHPYVRLPDPAALRLLRRRLHDPGPRPLRPLRGRSRWESPRASSSASSSASSGPRRWSSA